MLRSILLGFLIVLGALGGIVGYKAYEFLAVPPQTPGQNKIVLIEPGQNLDAVANMLVAEGVLRDADGFKLLAKFLDKGGRVKAGEFEVSTGWTPSGRTSKVSCRMKVSLSSGLRLPPNEKLPRL